MSFRRITVTAFLILILSSARAQKIDSLKLLLVKKEGIERANTLYELGRQYLLADQNHAAVQIGLEGYKIAEEFNDSLMMVKNGRIAASGLRFLGEIDSAINLFERILPLSKKNENSPDHLFILNGLALAYTYTAEYDKALIFNFQYLEKKQYNGDTAGEAKALNNIGLVYYKLKDYWKGQSFFIKAIALKEKIKDNYDLDAAFINLGLCYAYLGDFSNAKHNVQKGLQTCGNDCSDYISACADFAMGVISLGLKEYNDAENYCLKSYVLSIKNNDQRFQLDNIDYLTQIYLIQNRINDALYYLSKAEALINNGAPHNLELIKIYSRFIEMYNKDKNYERASFYQQKYIQLKDSVYSEELTTNLMKVEADYLEHENKAKIAMQEQILLLNEEVIETQKTLNAMLSLLVIFAIALTVSLWKNFARKKKANAILRRQVRARANEVKLSHQALIRAFKDSDLLIEKVMIAVKNTLSTIHGLSVLGLRDISDPVACQFIHKVNKTVDNLRTQLESFSMQRKKLTRSGLNHVKLNEVFSKVTLKS